MAAKPKPMPFGKKGAAPPFGKKPAGGGKMPPGKPAKGGKPY